MNTLDTSRRVRTPIRQGRLRLPTSAIVWGAWLAAALLVLISSDGWWVPAAALVAVGLTWSRVGRNRPGIGPVLAGLSLVLIGAWLVLGVVMHREGLGGRVLWVLPSWQLSSGGSFGGAVTTGQLEHALTQGLRGAAVLAVVALGFRAVAAEAWLRVVALTTGRAAEVLGPTVCLGEALSEQSQARAGLRAHGLDLVTGRLADLRERATVLSAEGLRTLPTATESGLRSALRLLLGCAGVIAVLVLAMRRTLAGPELVALAVLVGVLLGAVAGARGADTFASRDVAPVAGWLALLVVHYLVPDAGEVEAVVALAVLPALMVLPVVVRPGRSGDRSRRGSAH